MTHTFKKGDTGLTRGGRPYEVVLDDLSGRWPIVVVVTGPEGKYTCDITASGRYVEGETRTDDLMPPAPTAVSEIWANVYPDSVGAWYETRREVDDCTLKGRIAVLRRTDWSDGTRTYEEEPL